VKSHSWSTVKIDRNGLQFFYKYVVERPSIWVDIVKPPRKRVFPDILTVKEVERVINGTRELRYQTFILTAYGSVLRLGETLNLKIRGIDSERMKVHVRMGKKDRFVNLPEASLRVLPAYSVNNRDRFI
jgi:integrase/recombinase XerD